MRKIPSVRAALGAAVGAVVCVFALAACAAEDQGEARDQGASASGGAAASETQPTQTEEVAAPEPIVQAADCGWDSPRIDGTGSAPSDAPTNLAEQLIGAWQQTHFDSGAGFEPPEPDIRYIFPTDGGMLYCQDLPGVTDKAENGAEISISGNLIQPPGGHPGFEVVAISDNAMLWINNTDGSQYLLARR